MSDQGNPNNNSLSLQEMIQQKNPQIALYQAIERFLPDEFKPFLVDLSFEKDILWIKVSHPTLVQLLLWKKTAIMCELRAISTSLRVKGVRFCVVPFSFIKDEPDYHEPFSVSYAPTGEIEGDVVPLENEKLKELMDSLRCAIESREKGEKNH